MNVAIIKYNSGNIRSVAFALERLGINPIITDDINEIKASDKIIFPGVGEASSAMKHLKEKNLVQAIKDLKQPVFGICLGMQLMCNFSEEGNTDCLGIFKQNVKKFSNGLKVPQIGWNNINTLKTQLFENVGEDAYTYFVHSYYVEPGKETIASTDYGIKYSSSLHKNNFYAVQFHPEKSGVVGQKILKNFLAL
ncbi:MAG: imidazole glycerol phosphate synthase subunit HisH [FCB group bacterium]|jgi:glutamine amidotransferase